MSLTLKLPRQFDRRTMYGVIEGAINAQRQPRAKVINFDLSALNFIQPDGVTAFCNLIELLRLEGVHGDLINYNVRRPAIAYLDECGIFEAYSGGALRSPSRTTMIPCKAIATDRSHGWLDLTVFPWLANALHVETLALADLKVSVKEAFHNIEDHSTQKLGCMHTQYFPNLNKISISVSDFGIGIPASIRRRYEVESDHHAIRLALNEGVSAGTGHNNLGAGLDTLIRNVTGRHRGTVAIHSNYGQLVCVPAGSWLRRTGRPAPGLYPGTLISIELRTDTIEEQQREDLQW